MLHFWQWKDKDLERVNSQWEEDDEEEWGSGRGIRRLNRCRGRVTSVASLQHHQGMLYDPQQDAGGLPFNLLFNLFWPHCGIFFVLMELKSIICHIYFMVLLCAMVQRVMNSDACRGWKGTERFFSHHITIEDICCDVNESLWANRHEKPGGVGRLHCNSYSTACALRRLSYVPISTFVFFMLWSAVFSFPVPIGWSVNKLQ